MSLSLIRKARSALFALPPHRLSTSPPWTYNFLMLFDSLTIVGVGLIGGSVGLAAKARRPRAASSASAATRTRWPRRNRSASSTSSRPTWPRACARPTSSSSAPRSIRSPSRCSPRRRMPSRAPCSPTRQHQGEHRPRPRRPAAGARSLRRRSPAGRLGEAGGRERPRRPVRGPRLRPDADGAHRRRPRSSGRHCSGSALGCDIKQLTPEEHDQALATTSHLPHFVAALLAGSLTPAVAAVHGHRLPRHDPHRRRRPGPVDGDLPRERRRPRRLPSTGLAAVSTSFAKRS